MAFSEKDYQDGVSQLSLFTSCMFAELTIELEKGGGPLPAIRPDLQFLAERVRLVSQSLLRIYFSAKELDIASNLYYGSFSSHFRQVIKIVTFSQPFDKLPLYVTRKGGARWGKKLLDRPLFWTGRQPIYQDPWDNNTCIGLHMCISVIEKIIAGVLACLNATEGGLRELSPRNLSDNSRFVKEHYYLLKNIPRVQLKKSIASFFLDQSVVEIPSSVGHEDHNDSISFMRDEINHNVHPHYSGYDNYDKIMRHAPTLWSRELITAALDARPRLEDIEVWEGQNRCSKFAHSLGMLLLRCELEVSFQARRPKKMIVYLFADRLAIFRAKGAALVLQLDTYPRNLLVITHQPLKNPIYRHIMIYWEAKIDGTNSVRFAKLLFGNAEESKIWESFLAATLLPRAGTKPKV